MVRVRVFTFNYNPESGLEHATRPCFKFTCNVVDDYDGDAGDGQHAFGFVELELWCPIRHEALISHSSLGTNASNTHADTF